MPNYVAKYNGLGYAMRTALWHLLNEGTGTAVSLAALSGCNTGHLNGCLQRMVKRGLARPAPTSVSTDDYRRFRTYGLTPKGIEAALLVNETDVEFAKPAAMEVTA